jgi:hypothetical protein
MLSWDQGTGTTNYNLTICVNDTNTNLNCTIRYITYIVPAPAEGGGGATGWVTVTSNKTTFKETVKEITANPPEILKQIYGIVDYSADKLSPNNHKLGVFLFWISLGGLFLIKPVYLYIKTNYKLRKF